MKAHTKIHFDDSWKKAAFIERLHCIFFFFENCDYLLKNTNDGPQIMGFGEDRF